jgi:glycosyltransferase involved in cell wall biosynthesis
VRVLLDTTFARRGPSGTGVYVERLAAALREEGVEVVEARNARRRGPAGGGVGSLRNVAVDLAWAQVALRRRAEGADLVHHPLPMLTAGGPRPQVVTVHDLAFEALPGAFDPRFRRYARLVHRAAARNAGAVVCPSRATADDVARRWDVDPGRIVVAPHGPGQELPVIPRGEPRHLLYVGDDEPRKDLPTLLAAYGRYRASAADPLPLVLAGSARADADGVRTVERPAPAALAGLLADAAALVHPSVHEGFGLTVLEALRAGTPVIAADVPAVREVAAGAAKLVPPGSVEALAQALHEPPQAVPEGFAVAFSWRRSAVAHIAAYRAALGGASGNRRRSAFAPTRLGAA